MKSHNHCQPPKKGLDPLKAHPCMGVCMHDRSFAFASGWGFVPVLPVYRGFVGKACIPFGPYSSSEANELRGKIAQHKVQVEKETVVFFKVPCRLTPDPGFSRGYRCRA